MHPSIVHSSSTLAPHPWQAKWTEALTKWESSLPSDLGTEMWWAGIPARCRSRVWPVLIGNAMKVTPDVFALCLQRSKRVRLTARPRASHPLALPAV
jgi:hypothetical protein